jgi:two-component system, OmpR family, response regulator QseB
VVRRGRGHNPSMRVLVVEDDAGIATGLQAYLKQQGFAVDLADGVASAWAALRAEPIDMVLLDLGLRDGHGSDLLHKLRHSPEGALPDCATPVLIMTASDEIASRIAGLDQGADDYLTKPFDTHELAARMRALRRRARGRAQPLLRVGELEIDPAARRVTRGGHDIALAVREFALLLALAEVSPRVVSRAQLEARLYGWDHALGSNAIEVHIHHLRRKLGDDVIRTMRGAGYFVPATKGHTGPA